MTHFSHIAITVAAVFGAASLAARAEEGLASYQAIVSVADQKIAVLKDGAIIAKYPISTSKYGVGDASGSYKTPLGKLKVCEKLGDNLPSGAVIKHRRATGEVVTVNAPGRDPIVTRVLWLDGMESGNAKAKDRSIYIHGTPEEKNIGKPASYGCIRMKSEDVISLYNQLGVGATIDIVNDKLPHLAKYTPPKPTPAPKVEIAKVVPTPAPKVEVAKVTPPAPEKPVPPTSAKVQAAIAEAREHESKMQAEREEKEKQDAAAAAARVAKAEAPAGKPDKKTDKADKTKLAKADAPKADKPAAATLSPVAAGPKTDKAAPALVATNATATTARKRTIDPKPVVVPAPVDPERLEFLRQHEANLASLRAPSDMVLRAQSTSSGSTMDLSDRMKGSILDSGLPPHR